MTGPYVAVIGPRSADAETELIAYRAGELLAKHGAVTVCGGLGGAMEAVCRGAKHGGGLTIGLLPGNTRFEANQYVDVAVPTGMGEARNVLIIRMADGVIAVGGGYGTLSEIALALRIGKPVVGIGTWQASHEGVELPIVEVGSAEEAVEAILKSI